MCSSRDKVRIANGSLAPIRANGYLSLTPIPTSNIVHVLKSTQNLLSVSHVIRDLNYLVTYFHPIVFSGSGHREITVDCPKDCISWNMDRHASSLTTHALKEKINLHIK